MIQDLVSLEHVGVTRVTTTGVDAAFGTGGEARALWDPTDAERFRPEVVAVQDDGRVLVAGEVVVTSVKPTPPPRSVGIMRLRLDGALDPSFDGDGRVAVAAAADTTAVEVGQLDAGPNGRIVMSTVERTAAGDRLAVFAIGTGGRLDRSFGAGGRSVAVSGGTIAGKASVGIVASGRIVTGAAVCASMACRFVVARLRQNGTPDTAFGGDGSVEIEPGPDAALVGIHPFLSGEVLIVGWARDATSREPQDILVRLRPDGSGRPGFGTGGVVRRRAAFGMPTDLSAVQPDGKVLLSGRVESYPWDGSAESVIFTAIARLHWNGARDTGFGAEMYLSPGIVWGWDPGPMVPGSEVVEDLAVRRNGDILELASWYGEYSGGGGLYRLVPAS